MTEQQNSTGPAHTPGARKGEEIVQREGEEPGRVETTGGDHPTGKSTARHATGIDPQDPIDPKSPKLPPA